MPARQRDSPLSGTPGNIRTFTVNGVTVNASGFNRVDSGGAWSAALATRPDWVVISSWNAFPEDTQITPGAAYGRRALDQTTTWSQLFHTG